MVSPSTHASLYARQNTYIPIPQPYYTFDTTTPGWLSSTLPLPSSSQTSGTTPLTNLTLLTWNIDFGAPYPRSRMAAALSYLEQLVSHLPSSTAIVIFLQECMDESSPSSLPETLYTSHSHSTVLTENEEEDDEVEEGYEDDDDDETPSDLAQICAAPWIQSRFHLTDVSTQSAAWGARAPYGQVTLVDRRLKVEGVGRMKLVSEFGRSALFCDIRMSRSRENGDGGQEEGQVNVLRLCNVHLDSLSGPLRPVQWHGLTSHLIPHPPPSANTPSLITSLSLSSSATPPAIRASIIAGDTNATRPRDATAPQTHGFTDAYLVRGCVEGAEEGATWGFQSSRRARERFGVSRLDKVVFWSDGGQGDGGIEGERDEARLLEVDSVGRIGIGVVVDVRRRGGGEERDGAQRGARRRVWVTDHYGLMAVFEVGRGWGF
ncbi:hypothetical protein DM02DRAFT_677789 [Periconia macrospinosa]|uniref:Endonuclease/exonuclease/phosphatase domain-containing protein n=1 Tax=Periconia macrospinosa TaxID=97972 RepID=A0A2V1D1U1_9PLEO|nr:hypothetical protein DM02DRAFT_677789 [Periconia macrospinosa]